MTLRQSARAQVHAALGYLPNHPGLPQSRDIRGIGCSRAIMLPTRSSPRLLRGVCWKCQAHDLPRSAIRRTAQRNLSQHTAPQRNQPARWTWSVAGIAAAGLSVSLWTRHTVYAEAPDLEDGEMVFEKRKKRRDPSKEANRDAISSQHVQVKQSWENPGVYVWGSNTGSVADPASDDRVVKNPRRMTVFDGKLLRDMKLDRDFGAAIDEQGDLFVWGATYSPTATAPEKVLSGKNFRSLAISSDRIFALTKGGEVYSIPVSKEDQLQGHKPSEASWIPGWPSVSQVSYRTIDIPSKSFGESVTSVASGLEHGLMLTTSGRLFSFASSSSAYPSRGQLGVPGLFWETRPQGAYDQPHLVETLKGFKIAAVAVGDYHSLALDDLGRVFGFGDNSSGQLGLDVTAESPYIDAASLINTSRMYNGTSQIPRVTAIAAGGTVSFLTIDATRIASANDDLEKPDARTQVGKVTADTWSFGQGIYGTLGTGRWTHIQADPAKVKSLSGLFEWDEQKNSIIPIRMRHISVGSTHAAATMDNVTYVGATEKSSENDTNWGADVVWWGGNEHYQLGTGSRANKNVPTYIGTLEKIGDGSKREAHRLHLTPPTTVKVDGRSVKLEQRVECGRMVTAVYSKVL